MIESLEINTEMQLTRLTKTQLIDLNDLNDHYHDRYH